MCFKEIAVFCQLTELPDISNSLTLSFQIKSIINNFYYWHQSHYIEVTQGGVSNSCSNRAIHNWLWINLALFKDVLGGKKREKTNFQIDIMQLFSADATKFSKNILLPKTWKHGPKKLLIISPNFFFQYCRSAHNQPKYLFLFYKNVSLLDFYIMTLIGIIFW